MQPHIDGAPGLAWRRNGKSCYWLCRHSIAKAGFTPKSVRLWRKGEPFDANLIRSECARLQAAMLAWRAQREPPAFTGTVASLILAYREDPDSPFQALRYRTKLTYGWHLAEIARTVGARALAALGGRDFLRWYREWKADPDGSQHVYRAHARITMVRMLLTFGASILGDAHCQRLKTALAGIQFEAGRPRREFRTPAQAVAIRRAAHAMGRPSVALAEALCFDLGIRLKDAIGEWVPTSEPGLSAIVDRGQKWVCGLDWREVSPELVLTHRLSKSLRGRDALATADGGKVLTWDLKLCPMVMEELKEVGTGPLIIDEATGRPYRYQTFLKYWRLAATQAGLPATAQPRDSRSGAVTEALAAGARLDQAQQLAGHSDVKTTQRYSRGGDTTRAKVLEMRAKNRTKE